jgi:hypothetical protein
LIEVSGPTGGENDTLAKQVLRIAATCDFAHLFHEGLDIDLGLGRGSRKNSLEGFDAGESQ